MRFVKLTCWRIANNRVWFRTMPVRSSNNWKYHWQRLVQKTERPGFWKDYLNFYFHLRKSKAGGVLKRETMSWYVYLLRNEGVLPVFFIDDSTIKESSNEGALKHFKTWIFGWRKAEGLGGDNEELEPQILYLQVQCF